MVSPWTSHDYNNYDKLLIDCDHFLNQVTLLFVKPLMEHAIARQKLSDFHSYTCTVFQCYWFWLHCYICY